MKPLINITRLRGVEKQLERIAVALERIVLEQYNVPLQVTPKPTFDESDVLYTEDKDQFVKELRDLSNMVSPDRPIDVDDEDLR